jgi:serine protease Do
MQRKESVSMVQLPQDSNITALKALSDSIAATVDAVGRSTVALRGRGRHALGCGLVWRAGVLVTAAHVLGRAPATASVIASGQAAADLALIGTDATTDLAVFRLPDQQLPPVEAGRAADARTGELAIQVGRSQAGELSASVTFINRVSGPWQTWLGGHIDRLIRLDSSVHDGLSGAAVADAGGRVIGMATSALSRSYGIVVPESTISRVVDELLANGHVARAFLGIGAQPVSIAGARPGAPAESSRGGLLVTSLLADGPAAQGGLLVGDIVVDVADHRAASVAELRDALAGNIGKSVRISLIRGGAPAQAQVTVGQWPSEARAA